MKPRGTCVFGIFYDRETAPSSRRRRSKNNADGWPWPFVPLVLCVACERLLNSSITLTSDMFGCLPMMHSGFLVEIGVPTPKRCQRAPRQRYGSEAVEAKTFAPTSPNQRLLSLPPTANGEVSLDDALS